jgi:hypothetical protein
VDRHHGGHGDGDGEKLSPRKKQLSQVERVIDLKHVDLAHEMALAAQVYDTKVGCV